MDLQPGDLLESPPSQAFPADPSSCLEAAPISRAGPGDVVERSNNARSLGGRSSHKARSSAVVETSVPATWVNVVLHLGTCTPHQAYLRTSKGTT